MLPPEDTDISLLEADIDRRDAERRAVYEMATAGILEGLRRLAP